jgi:NAD-dependent deacetylase
VDGAALHTAATMLAGAGRVVVLTGAGVSAESGISTFRDKQTGLWAKYDPMELAHIDAFHRDPELVTRWYHWRFTSCKDCLPNPGHAALAEMQRWQAYRGRGCTLITQNIDGLHQKAGSTGVIELHGTILTWRCTISGASTPLDAVDFSAFPPRSGAGGLLRPNVVWFGEMLPRDAVEAAEQATLACDLFLSVGTSAVVWPAAGFAQVAREVGAGVIEINAEATPVSASADVVLRGRSGEILPELLRRASAISSSASGPGTR